MSALVPKVTRELTKMRRTLRQTENAHAQRGGCAPADRIIATDERKIVCLYEQVWLFHRGKVTTTGHLRPP